MKIQTLIENHWYHKNNLFLNLLLWPISKIYLLIVIIRRMMFRLGLKKSTTIDVPVVIVGNIGVGGAGKTPLTKYLASQLIARGIEVGIILRGYKSSSTQARIVHAGDNSSEVGDEALIYAQNGFKVAIGAKRVDAAKLLLKTYPSIQLILADDGMQHYYLDRDFEICVVDSTRLFGNQHIIPMGPLREPLSRLNLVDAIVINGNANPKQRQQLFAELRAPIYQQELEFIDFYNPKSMQSVATDYFEKQNVLALAAIGNPQRFFDYLQNLGLRLKQTKALPDHYHYQATDIPVEYAIITTEKDYTKLAQFAASNIWIARVSAKLENQRLIEQIIQLIDKALPQRKICSHIKRI